VSSSAHEWFDSVITGAKFRIFMTEQPEANPPDEVLNIFLREVAGLFESTSRSFRGAMLGPRGGRSR